MRHPSSRTVKFLWQGGIGLLFAAGVVVLLLWLAGRFSPKVPSRATVAVIDEPLPAGAVVVEVRQVPVSVAEQAVGSIRAQHETSIASRILARVVKIDLRAGQPVKQGDPLVQLDDVDLRARVEQARAALAAATAQRDQAAIDEKRLRSLIEVNAVSQNEYDRASTLLKTSEADVSRAKQAVGEAEAVLGYATVLAPMDGVVVDKKVNAGDTVAPGQAMLTLYDPLRMQLVANVRESLARRLTVGQEIGVRLDVLQKQCVGQVSEIVPDAQSASRTFQVKVTGPCPPGLYTGMFGRIFIPLDSQQVLAIPQAAVRRVGQLEMVDIVESGSLRRRAVRIGRMLDGGLCEVLSGLSLGEKVVSRESPGERPTTQPVAEVMP